MTAITGTGSVCCCTFIVRNVCGKNYSAAHSGGARCHYRDYAKGKGSDPVEPFDCDFALVCRRGERLSFRHFSMVGLFCLLILIIYNIGISISLNSNVTRQYLFTSYLFVHSFTYMSINRFIRISSTFLRESITDKT